MGYGCEWVGADDGRKTLKLLKKNIYNNIRTNFSPWSWGVKEVISEKKGKLDEKAVEGMKEKKNI